MNNIDNINEIYTFNDFISALKLFQSRQLNEYDTSILFDKIQQYVFAHFAVIFKNDAQSNINGNVLTSYGTNSNYDQDYSNEPLPLFIDFIKIFLNLHTTHTTNIALVSFISCIATYFVFYLLNYKEIWLAIMFVRLCEKYLLKPLHLRKTVNNDIDRSLLKDNLAFVIFNPSYIESKSLKCYNNITNTVLYSKLRLLLMIHALLEFRNSQASNINILYFILAKFTVFKLIRKKLLDDINFVLKIIIRNWKFLKGENAKVGSEEYILNGLTMKHTTEMLSIFQPSSQHYRNDISFKFFKDFYIGDEFGQFNNLTGTYCKGEEDTLINGYGFMNHVGIIQKWILFFINFFYSDMFDDCKVYLLNHITHSKMKQELLSTISANNNNIPDEVVNLGKLILFNVHLFINVLQMYSLELIQILLPSGNEGSCSCCYAEMFNNTFVKFVSPVDVPFLIFEFFATVNGYVTPKNQVHKMKKDLLLQKNISNYLLEIIERYKKDFNMSVYDGLEFCDFLIMKGVDCNDGNTVTKEVNSDVAVTVGNNTHSKIQKYIYVCFVWFVTLTYKTCTFNLLLKYKEQLISALMCMNGELRKKAFTFVFVVLNGYINYLNETVQHVGVNSSSCVNNNDNNGNNSSNTNTNTNTNATFIKSQHETFLELLSFQNDLFNVIINDELIMANIIKDYFDNYITNIGIIQTERVVHLYYTTLNTILYNTNKTDLLQNYTKHFHTPYYPTTTTNTTNIIHFRTNNIFDIFFTSNPDTSIIFALLCSHLSLYIHKPKLKSLLYVIFTVLRSHFSSYKSLDSIKSLIRDISLKKDKQHATPSLDHLMNLHFIKTTYIFVFLFIKYNLLQQQSQKGKYNIGNYLKWYSLYIIFISKNKDDFIKRVQTITTFITRDANLNDIEIKSNLRNIVKNICYGNIIFDYSNSDFINSISELLNYDQNITIEYTNITSNKKKSLRNNVHITNHKLKVVYTLATNEIFKDMFNTMLMHVNETYECYLTSKCEEFGEVKEQRIMFNRMNTIVKDMMGIDKEVNLVLDVCYSYNRNETLFNWVHGKPTGRKKLSCCDGDICAVIMDERQRNELNVGGIGNINDNNNNNDERNSSCSKNNIEKIYNLLPIKQKQKAHLNVISNSNKDIKYKLKLKRAINNNCVGNSNSNVTNTNTNINMITEGSYYNATAISSFIRKITRVCFYRFLSAVFWTYKSHIDKTELETLELLNIKPKDNTYISCILKEKYISIKELDQNEDTDYLNTSFDHCFYPFDILKLNKIKQGKGTRSKLLRELKKKKNKKRIHTLIKNKVTELKAKIAYYEDQMQELGLRFVSSVELNNNNSNNN